MFSLQNPYDDESVIIPQLQYKLIYAQDNQSGFLSRVVDEVSEYRCDCTVSQSCNVCETKKWIQMLQTYNPILKQQSLQTFPEDNFNIPLYLSKTYQIIHQILAYRSSLQKQGNQNEDEIFKLKSDIEALKVKHKRLQESYDAQQRQLGLFENQLTVSSKSTKQYNEKLVNEKDELNKLLIKAQTKEKQMIAEFKKKELEFAKLKDSVLKNRFDKCTFVNRFDVINSVKPNINFQESTLRKSLIDDNSVLQQSLIQYVDIFQNFYKGFQQYFETNDLIRIESLKIPMNACRCPHILNRQIEKIISFIQLTTGSITEEEFNERIKSVVPQDKVKVNQIIQKPNHVRRQISMKFEQKPEQQSEDLSLSIVSRISFKDAHEISFTGEKEFQVQEPVQPLKKWEFVFKN